MRQFPPIPAVEDAPSDLFESGHVWIQESIDGAPVRFQLSESGVVRFGDRTRVFDADEIPDPYRHVVRHVRERLDRDALRDAVDDVESVVFFGTATHRRTVDYDWDRIPSFLGHEVWSESRGGLLPPDAVEQIYERLDLAPVNTFEKEVRAADFDPESYEFPRSEWYDGPAAGVVVRNKTGGRAEIPNPEVDPGASTDPTETAGTADPSETVTQAETVGPVEESAEELARRWARPERFEAIADELAARGRPVTVDAVYERAVEGVLREKHAELTHRESDVDRQALRSEIAALARQFVADGETEG